MSNPGAPELSYRHIFGLKADVKNALFYLEENVCIYPAGHNLILYNTETKTQRFIHGSDVNLPNGRHEICAVALSSNKRYVAVAERGLEPQKPGNKAFISIFDVRTLKKRKTLTTTEFSSREIVSMCFSADNKQLLALGGAPEWALLSWQWQNSKYSHSVRVDSGGNTLYQCSYCPSDATLVCVTGKDTLMFYRVEQGTATLKPLEATMYDRDPEDYTAHVWSTSKKLIVGTSKGTILILENTMFRHHLRAPQLAGKAVVSLVNYSKGFICGCGDGTLMLFDEEDDQQYTVSRTFHVDGHPCKVTSIAVTPSEENLSITMEDSQAFSLKGFDADVLRAEDMRFEPLGEPFHSGAITGLDVAIRKPLVVTCGEDRSVRVWNYLTKTTELITWHTEQPHSVSFHPSGLHVLVGFADKLRLMNILMDDIRTFKEFPIKACAEVQFSHGGWAFAAVNGGLIQIYATYTAEPLAVFRGHTGVVKSLYWSLDDTSIISAGVDGAVYERKLNQTQRASEYVEKTVRFTSALCTEDGKIYAVGNDKILKEITERSLNKTLDANVTLTQLAVSNPPQRMLFAGTDNGVVRSFKFPLTGDVRDYQCHAASISRIRMSVDDLYLFTVGEDGCLAVFNIQEKDGRGKRDRVDAVPFAEEILVTKSDLEEKTSLMNELKSKVDELTASNEYQLRLHDMNYQEKLKEVSEKYNFQIQHDKGKIEMLRDEKQELEMEFDEKIGQLQTGHLNRLHQQDLEHQKVIMKEVGKYQMLQEEAEKTRYNHKNGVRERELRHHEEMVQHREEFEDALRNQRADRNQVNEDKQLVVRKFVETKSQLEEDTDKEIESLKEKYDTKLHVERDSTLRLKGENGIMQKKFSALQKDIEDQKENIKTMAEKEDSLTEHIKSLEEKIKSHKEDIDERDRTIGEKEKHIYDLKKDNQELEKFKFVLDYQIKELKQQIEPRENEIAEMKETVMKMDGKLETYHRDNGNLDVEAGSLRTQLKRSQFIIKQQRQRYRKSMSQHNSLCTDLHELVQHIQGPEFLKDGTKRLFHKHVTERIQATEVDPDVNKEYKRQRQYLERSVEVLKRNLANDSKARKNDNMRIMQENVVLIKEINKMRREIKLLNQVQRAKELNYAQTPQDEAKEEQETAEDDWDEAEASKILQMQRQQIVQLRQQIELSQQTLVKVQENPQAQ